MRIFVMGVVLICLAIILPVKETGTAQENAFIWVYTGIELDNFYWSPDSLQLVFDEDAISRVETTNGHWNSYDVETGELHMSTTWPLQPVFNPEEQMVFKIAMGTIRISFIYTSPNERYFIYSPEQEEPRIPAPLALGDRKTLDVFIEDDSLEDPFSGPSGFLVIWSEDSSAFIIRNNIPTSRIPWIIYVSHFAEDIQETSVEPLTRISLEATDYYIREVLDISANGDVLLLNAAVVDPESLQLIEHHLILWDMANNENSRVLGVWEDITYAGAFCPSGESRVVYLNGLDLYEQAIDSSEPLLLTRFSIFEEHISEFIAPRNPLLALFSPNGEYLVIHPHGLSLETSVYLSHLAELDIENSQCFSEE